MVVLLRPVVGLRNMAMRCNMAIAINMATSRVMARINQTVIPQIIYCEPASVAVTLITKSNWIYCCVLNKKLSNPNQIKTKYFFFHRVLTYEMTDSTATHRSQFCNEKNWKETRH